MLTFLEIEKFLKRKIVKFHCRLPPILEYKRALALTFSVQKMFGTFYRNIPTENAFSNIQKCQKQIAKPKYLLHGVRYSFKSFQAFPANQEVLQLLLHLQTF